MLQKEHEGVYTKERGGTKKDVNASELFKHAQSNLKDRDHRLKYKMGNLNDTLYKPPTKQGQDGICNVGDTKKNITAQAEGSAWEKFTEDLFKKTPKKKKEAKKKKKATKVEKQDVSHGMYKEEIKSYAEQIEASRVGQTDSAREYASNVNNVKQA